MIPVPRLTHLPFGATRPATAALVLEWVQDHGAASIGFIAEQIGCSPLDVAERVGWLIAHDLLAAFPFGDGGILCCLPCHRPSHLAAAPGSHNNAANDGEPTDATPTHDGARRRRA